MPPTLLFSPCASPPPPAPVSCILLGLTFPLSSLMISSTRTCWLLSAYGYQIVVCRVNLFASQWKELRNWNSNQMRSHKWRLKVLTAKALFCLPQLPSHFHSVLLTSLNDPTFQLNGGDCGVLLDFSLYSLQPTQRHRI